MTEEERIDAALDAVLRASGSALRNYTTPKTLSEMRMAMRNSVAIFVDDERERCASLCDEFGAEWMCDSHALSRLIRATPNV